MSLNIPFTRASYPDVSINLYFLNISYKYDTNVFETKEKYNQLVKKLKITTTNSIKGFDIKNYPNAYAQFVNEITLPLHTKLTDEDVDYVISNFRDVVIHYI